MFRDIFRKFRKNRVAKKDQQVVEGLVEEGNKRLEELKIIDSKILTIQKSTKTTFSIFSPVHNYCRAQYDWYYDWHAKPYSTKIHIGLLTLVLLTSISVAATSIFGPANSVKAATIDCTWTRGAGTSSWNTAGNWSCGNVPNNNNNVILDGTSNTAMTIDNDANIASFTVTAAYSSTITANFSMVLTTSQGGTGDFTLQGGTYEANETETVVTGNFFNSATFNCSACSLGLKGSNSGKTINTGGASIFFVGVQSLGGGGGSWTLAAPLNATAVEIIAGTLNTSTYLFTVDDLTQMTSPYLTVVGGTLNIGSGGLTLGSSAYYAYYTVDGGTVNWADNSTFTWYTIEGNMYLFAGSYYNVTLIRSEIYLAQWIVNSGVTIRGNLSVSSAIVDANQAEFAMLADFTVNGNVTFSSDITKIETQNHTITVGGNWSNSADSLLGTLNLVFNSAGVQTLNSGGTTAPYTFNNLTHSGAGTLQLVTNDLNVDGVFTNQNGGTFDADTNDKNMTFAGNWNNTTGGIFTRGSGTLTFDGTSDITDSSANTASLGSMVISGSATLKSWLIVDSVSGAGTLSLGTSNNTLTISGTGTPLTVATFQKGTGSRVKYTGADSTTVAAVNYYNLELLPSANSKTFTLAAGTVACTGYFTMGNGTNTGVIITAQTNNTILDIDGTLTIAANTSFTPSNTANINVGGSWTNNGTYVFDGTNTRNTVTFDGTAAGNTIKTNYTPGVNNKFYNMTINGTGGIWTINTSSVYGFGGGALNVTAGTLDIAAVYLNFGNINVNGGTLTGTTGTVHSLSAFNITGAGSSFVAPLSTNFWGTYSIGSGATASNTDYTTNSSNLTFYGGITLPIDTYYDLSLTTQGGTIVYTLGVGTTSVNRNLAVTGGGPFQVTFATGDSANTLTVGGNVTINTGTTISSTGSNINVGGNWANSGTLTPGTGTVAFTAAAGTQTLNSGGVIAGKIFNNLTHSGAGVLQLVTNNIHVDGTLNNAAGSFDITTNTKSIDCDGPFVNSGTLVQISSTLNFAGDWTNNGVFSRLISPGAMTFDGTSTISNNTSLMLDIIVTGTATLGTNLTLTSVSGAGTLNLGVNHNLTLTNTGTPLGVTNFNGGSGTSTAIYTGITVNVAAKVYNHLTLTPGGASTFSLAGDLTGATAMTGDLTINANATLQTKPAATSYNIDCVNVTIATNGTLTPNGSTFTVSGSWTNSGTFTYPSTSTLVMTGTGTLNPGSTYRLYNLTINSSGTVSLGSHFGLEAGGKFALTSGVLANGYQITLRSSSTSSDVFTRTGGSYGGWGTITILIIGLSHDQANPALIPAASVAYPYPDLQVYLGYSAGQTGYGKLNGEVNCASFKLGNYGASVASLVTNNQNLTTATSYAVNSTADFTINSTATLVGGSSAISVGGNWTNNGAFTAGTSTTIFNGSVAQTITGANTWNNLTIANTGTPSDSVDVESASIQTVNGILSVTDGQWTPLTGDIYKDVSIGSAGIVKPDASANINISGNFANAGTFTHNSGTVTLNGTITSTVSGSTGFNNLTLNTATDGAKTVNFASGSTQTVTGTTTLAGDTGKVLTLGRSGGVAGDHWDLAIAGDMISGQFVNVSDSNVTSGVITPGSWDLANVVDGGNNHNWNFDHTAPTGSIAIGGIYTKVAAVTLTLSATDTQSNLGTMAFSNDDATYSDYEAYGASKAWNLSASDGAKTVYVKYKDVSGNISAYSANITLDGTAPNVSSLAPVTTTPTNSQTVKFIWDAAPDVTSGLSKYYIFIGTTALGTDVINNVELTETSYTKVFDSGGTYYARIKAEDVAGNLSDFSTAGSVVIESEAPELTINNIATDFITTKNFTIQGTVSDKIGPVTTVQVKIDDGAFVDATLSGSVWTYNWANYAEGGHSILVKALDAAGNTKETSTYAVIVDTTAPTLASDFRLFNVSNVPASVYATYLDFAGSTDDTSGMKSYEIWKGGAKLVDVPIAKDSTNTYYTGNEKQSYFLIDSPLSSGKFSYKIKAIDKAGNVSETPDLTVDTAGKTIETDSITEPKGNPSSVVTTTKTSSIVTWKTVYPATSYVEYGESISYGQKTEVDSSMNQGHSVLLPDLKPATTYHAKVKSHDLYGKDLESTDFTFTTKEAPQDTNVIQVIINALQSLFRAITVGAVDTPVTSGTATADQLTSLQGFSNNLLLTDISFKEKGYFGNILAFEKGKKIEKSTDDKSYSSLSSGNNYYLDKEVKENTSYYYRLDAGNPITRKPVLGDDSALLIKDARVIKESVQSSKDAAQLTVAWTTNRGSSSQVEFGVSASYGQKTKEDTSLNMGHNIILESLTPDTTYHFKVTSKDAKGNIATSQDFTFQTPAAQKDKTAIDVIFESFQRVWNSITGIF